MFELPKYLKMGSATAATQIEGGDKNSNWYHWSLKGMIKEGASSIVAADHWHRVDEDIQLMRKMNHEIYRMSIEWSRIEPEEGVWSEEGIKHYQDEIRKLLEAGIEPLVTLHHFSQPQWFEDKKGWVNPKSVDYFYRFSEKIIDVLGDQVNEYCTINEPNVFCTDTFIEGKYPPGYKDETKLYFIASKHLILSHLKVYKMIHEKRKALGFINTKVGIALHMAYFKVKGMNPLTYMSKGLMNHSFHTMYLKGMVEGKLSLPLGIGYPEGKGRFCDIIGVNYYSRHLIHSTMNPAMLFGDVRVDKSLDETKLNDLGWEIYPEGMKKVIAPMYKKYQLPIYITENGIPDEKDEKRSQFIYDHLRILKEMIEEGIDIRKYYYWSLLDNLEWNDGYFPRFGLIDVNYETQERTIRKSGYFYSEICKEKKITKEMMQRYGVK